MSAAALFLPAVVRLAETGRTYVITGLNTSGGIAVVHMLAIDSPAGYRWRVARQNLGLPLPAGWPTLPNGDPL